MGVIRIGISDAIGGAVDGVAGSIMIGAFATAILFFPIPNDVKALGAGLLYFIDIVSWFSIVSDVARG